ncbi:MAG: dienelactone hydrolase family protein [Actinomycetota bacterium]|nr:dienelactone hydrolase family protein [Actinomycetota bacterium]
MPVECAVRLAVDAGTVIDGDLIVPDDATGIVVFAHGCGSGRHSPRNRQVAKSLQRQGLATLLVDLLTPDEERLDDRTGRLRFDIDLLASRLAGAAAWVENEPATGSLPVGYFGASTGAGAALVAAAQYPARVAAVVSRGGRPDLAGENLVAVEAPTLLIVGGRDEVVLELNHWALDRLKVERELVVVPGATHLFEEPGALEEVARLAGDWFLRYLEVAEPADTTGP